MDEEMYVVEFLDERLAVAERCFGKVTVNVVARHTPRPVVSLLDVGLEEDPLSDEVG